MGRKFLLINKNSVSNFWLNFWDSKFIYSNFLFLYFFLYNFLYYIFKEYFFIFKKQFKLNMIFLGKIWIYIFQSFFIININIMNFSNVLKKNKKIKILKNEW